MRNFLIASFFIFNLVTPSLFAQESAIVSTWWNAEKTSHIRVFKATNGKYYGKIEYLKENPDRFDINNPDENLRNQPLLGLLILKGFSYDEEQKQWVNGTIYDPDNGKTYDCYMWFDEAPDILYIKGFVLGMRFLGRETQWTKVN